MTWRAVMMIVGVLCLNLHAQSLDDDRAKGLAFFKKQAFLPDTNVVVYEYCYTRMDGRVLLFTVLNGKSIKVTVNNDILFVPYPGRGESSFEEATTAIQTASKRFPQYGLLLKRIARAWDMEQKRPAAVLLEEQNEAARRQGILDRFSRYLFKRANPDTPTGPIPAKSESMLTAPKPVPKENAENAQTSSGPTTTDSTDDAQIQALIKEASEIGKKH